MHGLPRMAKTDDDIRLPVNKYKSEDCQEYQNEWSFRCPFYFKQFNTKRIVYVMYITNISVSDCLNNNDNTELYETIIRLSSFSTVYSQPLSKIGLKTSYFKSNIFKQIPK